MALVKCGDCGRKVSDAAASCPQCGRPMRQRTAAPTIAGAGLSEAASPAPKRSGCLRPFSGALLFLIVFIGWLQCRSAPGPLPSAVGPRVSRPAVAPASALSAVVLESWKPHSAGERPAETAYGARVVVEAKTPTADELRALIVLLARGRDPVVIDVYSSEAAYRAWKENRYKAPVAKSGFLLSYAQRNGDGQLTWMQERGHLAALFGKSESISP